MTDSSTPFDVPENIIPQRGLAKAYQNERVRWLKGHNYSYEIRAARGSREGIPLLDTDVPLPTSEILVEMQDVSVRYGDKEVLGNWLQEVDGLTKKGLSWTIRRGERWGVFGPNGMC